MLNRRMANRRVRATAIAARSLGRLIRSRPSLRCITRRQSSRGCGVISPRFRVPEAVLEFARSAASNHGARTVQSPVPSHARHASTLSAAGKLDFPMVIESQEDVTRAVLAEMHRTPDARTKEILAALVRHLHDFVREVRLTEREFQEAITLVNAIGQKTTPSHNEAMLIAGALGVSNLVCLLNNGLKGTRPTQANNLGPFFREGAPHLENGA